MEASGVTLTSGTTKFVDDAEVAHRDESHVSHIDNTIIALNDTQPTAQSIIDFLRKPIILQTGSFNITDTFSFLNSYSMPYAAFTASQGSIWTNKLAGYYGIRMDMRFKIVVNANKMQQGRYMIGWVPLASPAKTTSNLKNVLISNMHLATLVQRTTVPHVELDLATTTSAELLVPFVSVNNFYPLNAILSSNDLATLGYMNIYPYSPLISPTGATTCGYTLFVSFENVTLYGAASAQSGLSAREVSNKQNGPISGIAKSLAKGFTEFSNIPMLSTYCTPISWVADRIAKTASVFGFSKPTQGDSMSKYQIMNAPAHTTVDGDSDARPLSYLSKSGVVEMDGLSGTNYDEMDFSYIIRKPAWFRTITWQDTAPVGNLATINVFPNVGDYTLGGALHYQPIGFVASFFNFWRGSIVFKFKIVKTTFHSGRLQFCFYPTDEASYTGNPAYVNRMIIDIRETNELELVIPYISRSPWSQYGVRTGVLTIDVVDYLTAPANVSNAVTILCEVAGGHDMEFAIPRAFEPSPTYFAPQSGLDSNNVIVSSTIGDTNILCNPTIFSSSTIGDKVSNFRAYLKRFHPLNPSSKETASTSNLNGAEFYMYSDVIFAQGTPMPTYFTNADYYSAIASCYALTRGGIRIRDVINTSMLASDFSNNSCTMAVLDTLARNIQGPSVIGSNAATATAASNFHIVLQQMITNNTITVEIPQYTLTLCRAKADIITFQGSTGTYGYSGVTGSSNTKGLLSITLPAGSTTGFTARAGYSVHNIHRALADDAGFSCFISIPPMVGQTVVGGKRGLY